MRKPIGFQAMWLALAALLVVSPAFAKKSPGPTVLISPDESVASEMRGNARVDTETGMPIALYRVGYAVDPGTPEQMARQYLRENASVLGLRSTELDDLVHHATREGRAATTVRFKQQISGVRVYGAEITVTIDHDNVVNFVMSTYKPASLASAAPVRSASEARQAAFDLLGVEGTVHYETTDLVAYHNKGTTRLAHRVRFSPLEGNLGDWEVLRDAHTGEIFKAVDQTLYVPVDGTGDVFDPDPLSSAGATYNDPGYTDGNDANTPQLNAEEFSRTLRDIDLTGGIHSLTGPWAEVVDWDTPFKGDFSQASSDWNFDRFDDAFEAANTYYHIDVYMRYMNVTLGLDVRPYQYPGGVQFDPSGFGGADNSSYSTGTGRLRFGEGGVDDAEDADVVIHELGHGIHDWVTNGGLSQVNGLSEGVGDYFAQSYSRSFGQWDPADPAYHWVFSWDGHNPFWGGRRTNYTGIYPDDLVGQVHTDGQIWSTCNMRIWDAIGQEKSDAAQLEGLAMTNGGTNQQDAAQAVLQSAVDMGYTVSEINEMQTIFQSCGYDVMVTLNDLIFTDGFESGDTTGWSNSSL